MFMQTETLLMFDGFDRDMYKNNLYLNINVFNIY